ncbi:MAG TPA: sodium/glutamate symporter [Burkholderiaceae bacterium]|nr:sodium/glutamate symporter [Burkholderiaceae bacterium]
MQIGVDIWFTLALAATALVLGRAIVDRVHFLSHYSIPDAVVGGLLFSAVILLLRGAGNVQVSFDPALLTPLNVMFFTTVGLSADARSLAKGGKLLLVFLVVVVGSLLMQNAIGVGLARLFDIHPANGLLAGSITLTGGHGTAAAWGSKFVEERNLQGAVELGIAAATYGLVIGGLFGGPFANWLLRRHGISGPGGTAAQARAAGAPPAPGLASETEAVPVATLVETLLLIFVSMAVGFMLYDWFGRGAFTLPTFIWALVVGAVLRNLLSLAGFYEVDDRAVELLGTLSLSLFLAMIIMTLRLWELVDLAGPIVVILVTQTIAMLAYCALITYRFMGRNYDAVLLATGHLGFGLGSTATAMVNVQTITDRHGHSPLAFLLIPVMGAFLVDLANALIIQGFLFLPGFTW